MKTKLLLAALLASAAFAQATPAITPAKSKTSTQSNNGRAVFHTVGQKTANGPFLNHPETAPGPH